MKENKPLFGSKFYIKENQNYLMAEISILRSIVDNKMLHGRAAEISIMILTLLSTGSAIVELAKNPQRFYNECVMLARGFFERLTNVCYLLLCDDKTFEKCIKHTVFRQYAKKTGSNKAIKDKDNNILMKLSLGQEGLCIDEELDKYGKQHGDRFPIPDIPKRLGYIAKFKEHVNVSLLLAYQLSFYDDASEALHGSLYGSLFHVLNIATKDKNILETETNKNMSLLLLETGELIHQLIHLLNKNNDLTDILEKSTHNSEAFHKKLEFATNNSVMI